MRVAYVNDDEAQFTAEDAEIPRERSATRRGARSHRRDHAACPVWSERWGQGQTASQLAQSVARAVTHRADLAFLAEAAPTAPAVAPVAGLAHTTGLIDGGARHRPTSTP